MMKGGWRFRTCPHPFRSLRSMMWPNVPLFLVWSCSRSNASGNFSLQISSILAWHFSLCFSARSTSSRNRSIMSIPSGPITPLSEAGMTSLPWWQMMRSCMSFTSSSGSVIPSGILFHHGLVAFTANIGHVIAQTYVAVLQHGIRFGKLPHNLLIEVKDATVVLTQLLYSFKSIGHPSRRSYGREAV